MDRPFGDPFAMLKKPKETERRIHTRLAKYLRENYPRIRFHSSLDGEYFGEHQRAHIGTLQWGNGFPDLMIYHHVGQYCGLAIELKTDKGDPFKKDGTIKKNVHLQEQNDWLNYLEDHGWRAVFGIGYENCKDIIDEYIKHTSSK
jgi:hypothetical protein